jgi:2-methylcitrate dehydratase PrpD
VAPSGRRRRSSHIHVPWYAIGATNAAAAAEQLDKRETRKYLQAEIHKAIEWSASENENLPKLEQQSCSRGRMTQTLALRIELR